MVVKGLNLDRSLFLKMNFVITGMPFLVKKMKKHQPKPIKLINPLNQENWWCLDYSKTHSVDGVDYIIVFKPENTQRQLLMRKDALRKVSTT